MPHPRGAAGPQHGQRVVADLECSPSRGRRSAACTRPPLGHVDVGQVEGADLDRLVPADAGLLAAPAATRSASASAVAGSPSRCGRVPGAVTRASTSPSVVARTRSVLEFPPSARDDEPRGTSAAAGAGERGPGAVEPAARQPSTTESTPSALTRSSVAIGERAASSARTASTNPSALPMPPPSTIRSGSTTAMIEQSARGDQHRLVRDDPPGPRVAAGGRGEDLRGPTPAAASRPGAPRARCRPPTPRPPARRAGATSVAVRGLRSPAAGSAISPAAPCAPRRSRPSRTRPIPMPVPIETKAKRRRRGRARAPARRARRRRRRSRSSAMSPNAARRSRSRCGWSQPWQRAGRGTARRGAGRTRRGCPARSARRRRSRAPSVAHSLSASAAEFGDPAAPGLGARAHRRRGRARCRRSRRSRRAGTRGRRRAPARSRPRAAPRTARRSGPACRCARPTARTSPARSRLASASDTVGLDSPLSRASSARDSLPASRMCSSSSCSFRARISCGPAGLPWPALAVTRRAPQVVTLVWTNSRSGLVVLQLIVYFPNHYKRPSHTGAADGHHRSCSGSTSAARKIAAAVTRHRRACGSGTVTIRRPADGRRRADPAPRASTRPHAAAGRGRRRTGQLAAVGACTFGIPHEDRVRAGAQHVRLGRARLRPAGAPGVPRRAAVTLATDVKAAAQAELDWGALAGCDPGLYVNLGTGLAVAIVVGGHVVAGAARRRRRDRLQPAPARRRRSRDAPSACCWRTRSAGRRWQAAAGRLLGRPMTCRARVRSGAGRDPAAADVARPSSSASCAFHLVNLAIAIDPERIVVGGGLVRSWDATAAAAARRARRGGAVPTGADARGTSRTTRR